MRATSTISAVVLFLTVLAGTLPAQQRSPYQLAREAQAALDSGEFDQAIETYDQALEALPDSDTLLYNQGVAQYRKGDLDAARELFLKSLKTRDPELEAKAKFNLGNCAYASALAHQEDIQTAVGELEQAIRHYKDAIRAAPDDEDPRVNMEMSQLLMKQLLDRQQQQQNQQGDGEQNDQQQEQQDQQQQEPQDQQQEKQQQDQQQSGEQNDRQQEQQQQSGEQDRQEQESEHEQQQQQSGEEQKGQEQQQQQQQGQQDQQQQTGDPQQAQQAQGQKGDEEQRMTREQAMRLLQLIRDREMQRREQLRRSQRARLAPVEKDW